MCLKFSKLYDVGTLNLCLETPGTMQKGSAQLDHLAWRKRPKWAISGQLQKTPIFLQVMDVFSGQGDQIELISFSLCQVSQDTSLEYTQNIILVTLKFHLVTMFFGLFVTTLDTRCLNLNTFCRSDSPYTYYHYFSVKIACPCN